MLTRLIESIADFIRRLGARLELWEVAIVSCFDTMHVSPPGLLFHRSYLRIIHHQMSYSYVRVQGTLYALIPDGRLFTAATANDLTAATVRACRWELWKWYRPQRDNPDNPASGP